MHELANRYYAKFTLLGFLPLFSWSRSKNSCALCAPDGCVKPRYHDTGVGLGRAGWLPMAGPSLTSSECGDSTLGQHGSSLGIAGLSRVLSTSITQPSPSTRTHINTVKECSFCVFAVPGPVPPNIQSSHYETFSIQQISEGRQR